jgi:NAD(P)-dependent dehydrogenase (short-subunit alcohol dehydrogenase family)
VAKHNVIVSAVAPGAIYTEGRYFAKLRNEDPAMLQKYLDENLPTGRLGEPKDIAPVVTLLCSDQASFMAGSIVAIDGAGK